MRRQPVWPHEQKIRQMVEQGLSSRHIAMRLGVKYQTLRKFMSVRGIRAARHVYRRVELHVSPNLYAALETVAGHRSVNTVAVELLARAVAA